MTNTFTYAIDFRRLRTAAQLMGWSNAIFLALSFIVMIIASAHRGPTPTYIYVLLLLLLVALSTATCWGMRELSSSCDSPQRRPVLNGLEMTVYVFVLLAAIILVIDWSTRSTSTLLGVFMCMIFFAFSALMLVYRRNITLLQTTVPSPGFKTIGLAALVMAAFGALILLVGVIVTITNPGALRKIKWLISCISIIALLAGLVGSIMYTGGWIGVASWCTQIILNGEKPTHPVFTADAPTEMVGATPPPFDAQATELLNNDNSAKSDQELLTLLNSPGTLTADQATEASMTLYKRPGSLLWQQLEAMDDDALRHITTNSHLYYIGYILAANDILSNRNNNNQTTILS